MLSCNKLRTNLFLSRACSLLLGGYDLDDKATTYMTGAFLDRFGLRFV